MTGSKLSLRRQTSPSQSNSSADESSGPISSYRKIVGRSRTAALSPVATQRASFRPQSPRENIESENDSCSELTLQLRKLGKYLEKKQGKAIGGGGDDGAACENDLLDPQMDEHFDNIRKALSAKSPK